VNPRRPRTAPALAGLVVLLVVAFGSPLRQQTTVAPLPAAAVVALPLAAVPLLVRRGIRRRVGPLLRTAGAVLASDDHDPRVHSGDRDEIDALRRAIDTMLAIIAAQEAALERAVAAREEQLRTVYAERRLNERQARERAQEMIDSSVSTIMGELQVVVDKTEELRGTADTIDEQVGMTDTVTHRVVEQARRASDTVEQLEASLRKVEGIAHIISSVASQTHLLALNATIEAVHAGEAGRGFGVVADEVKDLAAATTRSAGEITDTIRSLEENAHAMTGVLTEMAGGVGHLGEAASQVGVMTRRQHTSVDLLKEYLDRAIHRISTMAHLSEQLERRTAPRAAVSGETRIHGAGHAHPAQMLDLSASGAHFSSRPDTPLRKGDHVEVDIPLGGAAPLTLSAEIVHHTTRDDTVELGLRFADVPPSAADRIHRHVVAALGSAPR
jgi:methyl-accepting chemotaxis protein